MIDEKDCIFRDIVITRNDGTTVSYKPTPGQNFIVMSWMEENEGLPEEPGLLLMHCSVEVAAKMIDRLFHRHSKIWDAINKLWAFHEHVIEAQKRIAEKRAEKYRGIGPKDGKWN
jgi:hypothetical protein